MAEYFVDLKDLDQKVSLEGSFEPGEIDFTGESVSTDRPAGVDGDGGAGGRGDSNCRQSVRPRWS